ncbi:glutenin, high molecular weight subunit PW212-like [Cornus florida]|uniref:glutenin, high molecular weight subunit PW212-like n=1 Tax=Cornus florida TaxID=4283 RepID=UPI00289A685E|nr:glutenin, high molecular weight subunit PW212-like [Cornus florida]
MAPAGTQLIDERPVDSAMGKKTVARDGDSFMLLHSVPLHRQFDWSKNGNLIDDDGVGQNFGWDTMLVGSLAPALLVIRLKDLPSQPTVEWVGGSYLSPTPPTSQTGYGTQQPNGDAPDHGTPQAQKPPANHTAYGQAQQSPGVQGGYAQPGYPHSQPAPTQSGYAQTDSGAQRAPTSGYGTATAQPGYGAPPYGALPVAQPGYGQQQQPPPYNSSYGGGYSQTPAYPTDGSSAPASQAVQSGSVAKTSPQG